MPKMTNKYAKEYLHHLHDTLILLGAPPHLAAIASNPDIATDDDINTLRKYNMTLIDQHKTRLTGTNKMTVIVGKPPQ